MRKTPQVMALKTLLALATADKLEPLLQPAEALRAGMPHRAWTRAGVRAVREFIDTFREPTSAPWVEVAEVDDERGFRDLTLLLRDLDFLLRAGFNSNAARAQPLTGLRFGVKSAGRDPEAKRSAMSRKERRTYDAPGAYVLQVSGTVHDLVLYLVLTLLTAEGMTGAVSRCPAPARGDYGEQCGGWVVSTGRRPQEYCGVACRVRQSNKKKAEERATVTGRRTRTKKETRR